MTTHVNPPEWGGGEVGALNGQSGDALAHLLITLVGRHDVRTICDLGCGNGYLAHLLGRRGYEVTGVDASRPYIETAQRLYASPSVGFKQSVFGEPAVRAVDGRHFDMVISSDVIEHLYRPAELLETAHRLLKPNGILIVGTPYHGYAKNLAIVLLGKWDVHHSVHWDGGHIKFFSVPALRGMVERHGFTQPAFDFYGRMPWLWKNMICTARRVP